MRNLFLSLFTLVTMVIMFAGTGCNKDQRPPSFPEEDLKISIDAPSYTLTPAPDFQFQVKVESAMPRDGVKIEYSVNGESDNQVYPQAPAIFTSDKTTRLSITGLPRQKLCICAITVTSKAKSTNKATTSFRVGYK